MKRPHHAWNHIFNFLAVILGVYLAFYINEKAIANKERNESVILMNSMRNDLQADIKTYNDYQIPGNVTQQERIGKILELLLADSLVDIGQELALVFQVDNYTPTNSTYSSMKSTGKLVLLNDLALEQAVSNFYEGSAMECIKKSEFQVDYFTTELLPWLTRNVDLVDMSLLSTDELIILRNKLIIYESLIEQKVNTYRTIVAESEELVELLNARL